MISISLDQTVRPVLDSVPFVPASDKDSVSPHESFDSHLARHDETDGAERTPESAAKREKEDEPERDQEASAPIAAGQSPAAQEKNDEPMDEKETTASDGEIILADKQASDTKVESKESVTVDLLANQIELKAVAKPIAVDSALPNALEKAKSEIAEVGNEKLVEPTVDLEVKTIDVAEQTAASLHPLEAIAEQTVAVTGPAVDETGEVVRGEPVSPRPSKEKEPSRQTLRRPVAGQGDLPVATQVDAAAVTQNPALPEAELAVADQKNDRSEQKIGNLVDAAARLPDRDQGPTHHSATNRLAQHLAGATDERMAKGNSLTGTDQNRFLDRVARAVQAAENRQGVVKLRLHPPELGSLRIELRVQNGALTARLEAETATTQSLLIEHAYALRDRLSEQGVRVERFDVDLADRRSLDHPGGFDDRANRDREQTNHMRRPPTAAKNQDATFSRPNPAPSAPGKINVII